MSTETPMDTKRRMTIQNFFKKNVEFCGPIIFTLFPLFLVDLLQILLFC